MANTINIKEDVDWQACHGDGDEGLKKQQNSWLIIRIMRQIFSIDLRSLALFRIALALIVMGDMMLRAADISVFYSDAGVLPRNVLLNELSYLWWSIHLLSGLWWWQAMLFSFTLLGALALLLGYRTRLATFVVWFLLVSLHNRFPHLQQGGDQWLRLLLFWSIFVPLGSRYSIDYALNSAMRSIPKKIFSIGTVALLSQILLVYISTAISKDKDAWWFNGSTIYYALSIDQFAKPLAYQLLQYPVMMRLMSRVVFLFETFGPILLIVPNGWVRCIGVLAFISFHLGMGQFMELGPFTYVGATAALAFLPSLFWDRINLYSMKKRQGPIIIYFDEDCGFCRKTVLLIRTFLILPNAKIIPAQNNSSIEEVMKKNNSWVVLDDEGTSYVKFSAFTSLIKKSPILFYIEPLLRKGPLYWLGEYIYNMIARYRGYLSRSTNWLQYRPLSLRVGYISTFFASVSFLCLLWWNVAAANNKVVIPSLLHVIGQTLRLDQGWNMFDKPFIWDGWYVIPGQLQNGRQVDLFDGGKEVSWHKPRYVSKTYSNERWRKFMMVLWQDIAKAYRPNYSNHLCREWNKNYSGQERLTSLTIVFMQEITPEVGTFPSPITPQIVWEQQCP